MHRLGIDYVQSLGKNLSAVLFPDVLGGCLQRLRVAGAHRNPASLGGEGFGGGAANPLAGGRYNRNPIPQTGIHGAGIIKGTLPAVLGGTRAFYTLAHFPGER
jgi:hypothetical protein